MKIDGVELYGVQLSQAILKTVSKIEQEMIYDRTREFIKMEIHMVNFCNMMRLRFGKRDVEEPDNYRLFLEYEDTTKDSIIQISAELAIKLKPEQLKIYCYLSGISHYFDYYELDWMKVCDDYTKEWRDFFRTIKELQSISLIHPYIEYPILITDLSNVQLDIIINSTDKEEAYELLQKYRRIITESEC